MKQILSTYGRISISVFLNKVTVPRQLVGLPLRQHKIMIEWNRAQSSSEVFLVNNNYNPSLTKSKISFDAINP